MSIRTFWTILIKILGIYLVLRVLAIIWQFLGVLPFFGSGNQVEGIGYGLTLLLFLLTLAPYFIVLWLFVFKTTWLVDKLHLDKGFKEEKIELNISQSTVLMIAIITIGGLIFVDSFSSLCQQIFVFFQEKRIFKEYPGSGLIIFELMKTIFGYILLTKSRMFVRFIEREVNHPENNKNF